MNLNLGFLLSYYGDEELSSNFIKSANDFLENNIGTDIIGFVSNHVRPSGRNQLPQFATLNINEAYDYNGAVIATSIDMAEKCLGFPGPKKKYYYMWELDWITVLHRRTFEQYIALFNHPKLTLVTRTEADKQMVEKCWNRKVGAVIPDCNVKDFAEMVNGYINVNVR